MTAIAISYTSFGFAIAADGRQQWQHAATRHNAARGAESDEVQKIFQIQRRDATFAFTLSGDTANRDRSFDLCTEVRNQVTQLQKTRFFTPGGFVGTLSEYVTAAIQTARNEHRIEDYPQSSVTLVLLRQHSLPCEHSIRALREEPPSSHHFSATAAWSVLSYGITLNCCDGISWRGTSRSSVRRSEKTLLCKLPRSLL